MSILEYFEKRLNEFFNGEYSITENSRYINKTIEIELKHNLCGTIFKAKPCNMLRSVGGSRCPTCYRRCKRRSNKDFIEDLKAKLGEEYIPQEPFKNVDTKMKILHTKCGRIWKIMPKHIFGDNASCPYCSGIYKKTDEDVKRILKEKFGNEYELVGKFKGSDFKSSFRHKKCGRIWEVSYTNFITNGNRCPFCFKFWSKGESKIEDILNNLKIKYEREKTFPTLIYKKHLYLDFYLPDYNIAIEYNGIQHYDKKKQIYHKERDKFKDYDFNEIKSRDKFKEKWLSDNGIILLEYTYKEYKYLEEALRKDLKKLKII